MKLPISGSMLPGRAPNAWRPCGFEGEQSNQRCVLQVEIRPSCGRNYCVRRGAHRQVALHYLLEPPNGTLYTTTVGGHRTLTLSDGSRIELNTDSVLRLEDGERSAILSNAEKPISISGTTRPIPFRFVFANHRIVDVAPKFIVRSDARRSRVTLMEGEARLETTGNRQSASRTSRAWRCRNCDGRHGIDHSESQRRNW